VTRSSPTTCRAHCRSVLSSRIWRWRSLPRVAARLRRFDPAQAADRQLPGRVPRFRGERCTRSNRRRHGSGPPTFPRGELSCGTIPLILATQCAALPPWRPSAFRRLRRVIATRPTPRSQSSRMRARIREKGGAMPPAKRRAQRPSARAQRSLALRTTDRTGSALSPVLRGPTYAALSQPVAPMCRPDTRRSTATFVGSHPVSGSGAHVDPDSI